MDFKHLLCQLKKHSYQYSVFIFLFFVSNGLYAQVGWNQINSFGNNPGNLNMYCYAPISMPSSGALVVVMHGCTQNALQCATQSGWNRLADQNGFYVMYPEQKTINNSSNCFNWFNAGDQSRGQGEVASISEMIKYMTNNFNIDTNRIFVSGLSAGAAMSVVMMSAYPDIIAKGAVMAGGPYKAATNILGATSAMNGQVIRTPQEWGDLVRNENPWYTGDFPKLAIFHGTADPIVNINNAYELVKQWTNLNGTDQLEDYQTNNFSGNTFVTKSVYQNLQQNSAVEKYIISGFGHAIALDTGSCLQQGGEVGNYAIDINFNAVYWAARFFGIVNIPYQINGSVSVMPNQNGITYSVSSNSGSTYQWTVPSDASITFGQGSASIQVDFGTLSGNISVTETTSDGCIYGPLDLFVDVNNANSIADNNLENIKIYYNTDSRQLICSDVINKLSITDINGKIMSDRCSERINENIFLINEFLSKGVYLVKIDTDKYSYHRKIIII